MIPRIQLKSKDETGKLAQSGIDLTTQTDDSFHEIDKNRGVTGVSFHLKQALQQRSLQSLFISYSFNDASVELISTMYSSKLVLIENL